MRFILFVCAIIVVALTCASGQVQDPSLEKGQIEDLKGTINVYVGTSGESTRYTTLTIIETVRKKLPQITFVSKQEEADVSLLFSSEKGTETESNPGPSLDARSSTKFISILRSQGRVIRVREPNPAKLIKKFFATGRSNDGDKLARDFAEEFIKLYRKANPDKLSDVTRHPASETAPQSLPRGTLFGDAVGRASSNKPSEKPEPPVMYGKIEDLKGVATVYVGAPDHYSSLFLRKIVEKVRKRVPHLVFVWARNDADVWLLFSVESNLKDARVRGSIIRSFGRGPLRLIKQYSAGGSNGADDFAQEFVKSYQKANPGPQPDFARLQQPTTLPPRLKGGGPVAITGGLTSGRSADVGAELGDGDTLRIDTSLVTILAYVIGRNGMPAAGMHRDDFSVYEDDVKQNIAFFEPVDRPFTVLLLIDSSTSVEAQLTEIEEAAKVLVDRLRPDDQLVVITFDAMVKEVLKLTKIRDLRGEWVKISPHGGTRVYDAVDFAASEYLRRLPGRKAVVLLTDGVDFGSFITTAEGSLHDAEEYDALFYTVQYKSDELQSERTEKAQERYERATTYLRELAAKTGGRYHRAEEIGDLSPAFSSIVKELSCQYSLGYYPTRPPQPGQRRRVQVRVSQSDFVIHTRDSYVFKGPQTEPVEPK